MGLTAANVTAPFFLDAPGTARVRALRTSPANCGKRIQNGPSNRGGRSIGSICPYLLLGFEFQQGMLALIEGIREGLYEHLQLLKARAILTALPGSFPLVLRFHNVITREVAREKAKIPDNF